MALTGGELEKVLDHYSQLQADSLKLQAAVFLIENMPGHYTFTSDELEAFYDRVDTLQGVTYHAKKMLQTIPFDHPEYRHGLKILEDVKCITADFLIHHIDLAFRQWETLPWLEGLDFETFKESLLPYRVANEPLDYWRDSIEYFRRRLENSIKHHEDCRYSAQQMGNKFYSFPYFLQKRIPDKRLQDYKIDCIPTSKHTMFIYRIIGIPSTLDFIPHYSNRNGRHYWAAVTDMKYKTRQLLQTNLYRVGKIYRRTYSHNPVVVPHGNEYIPGFFRDPFNKDVTTEYLPTTDVTIDIPQSIRSRHAYLAVFNDLTWKPIACSEISGRKARFRAMGRDAVYLPVYYTEEEEMLPLGSPFIIQNQGNIQKLEVCKDSVQSLRLKRKYPNNSSHESWFRNLIGTRFESSNYADFREVDTLTIIDKRIELTYQYIAADTALKRRYWRFIGITQKPCYLSQLAFHDQEGQQIKGKLIGPDAAQSEGLLNDNPLSFCLINEWVGVDFGHPVSLSGIRYLPRNDANTIFPGDDYELFFYKYPEGWVSAGIQHPETEELIYENVPAGTLYWLRNLTQGVEERIFIKSKNNIVFL